MKFEHLPTDQKDRIARRAEAVQNDERMAALRKTPLRQLIAVASLIAPAGLLWAYPRGGSVAVSMLALCLVAGVVLRRINRGFDTLDPALLDDFNRARNMRTYRLAHIVSAALVGLAAAAVLAGLPDRYAIDPSAACIGFFVFMLLLPSALFALREPTEA